MKTRRVKLKIEHDPNWRSDLRFDERYWVFLSDGNSLPIFKGFQGRWHQLYAQHVNYLSFEAALAAALVQLYETRDARVQWKACRCKEQSFTFSRACLSSLKLPRKQRRYANQGRNS